MSRRDDVLLYLKLVWLAFMLAGYPHAANAALARLVEVLNG